MKQNLSYNSTEVVCIHSISKVPESKDFYDSHIHNHYELLFFCDGDADFIISGSIYHLQKNDLLLIKPSVYHNLRLLSSHSYERIVFSFQESALLEELIPFIHSANSLYRVGASSPIKHVFDSLRAASELFSKEEFDYLSKTSLNHIILHLKHHFPDAVKAKILSTSPLETILLYIDENPTLTLTIATLAGKFNLSESWIAHSFKRALGISPSQYINRKKITYAKSLIDMGMSPVQAADVCGYVNYTTFYRQYKKYLGVSPAKDAKR